MRAIIVHKDKHLSWSIVPDPILRVDEVLVEIHAAALNRADLMQRDGDYPPPPGCPEWMGLEISGIVCEMGPEAQKKSRWQIGDQVCALLGGGGYAEYAAVRDDMLMPIPKGISMVEAAAMPEAFATSYLNLFIEGRIQSGNTLLMHAGASGLASVVIPMAKAFGIRVVTSVQNSQHAKSISHLHADYIINSEEEDVAEVLIRQANEGHPIDVAIDCLGGKMMGQSLSAMQHGGRWIMIAAMAGSLTEIDLKTVFKKNIRIIGSTLRSRTSDVKAQILSDLVSDVWPKVETGLVRTTIYTVMPIQQAEEAHMILKRGENVGKVVLTVHEGKRVLSCES